MLDNLLDLVKQHAGSSVIDNPAVPNQHNDAVVQEASNSVLGGLKNMLDQGGGGVKDIMQLFAGKSEVAHSPVTQNIAGGFVQKLMDQFGMERSAANGVAEGLVPNVLQSLVSKTNDPSNNQFNIQSLFNQISGGSTSSMNLQGMLDKVKGGMLDIDGDGDTDLQDLMAAFKGKAGQSGGIGDTIKGLFN